MGDNNQTAGTYLGESLKFLDKFLDSAKNMNIEGVTEENKSQLLDQLEKTGGNKILDDAKNQIQTLRDKVKNMTNATNKAQ